LIGDRHGVAQGTIFILACGGDFLSPQRVTAQDIARPVCGCDLGQGLIEERHLHRAVRQEGLDLGLGDGGDVMELLFPEGVDLGVFDHAPIPNERDRPTPEALRDLIDLRGEGP
jgi:hypothetical protein